MTGSGPADSATKTDLVLPSGADGRAVVPRIKSIPE